MGACILAWVANHHQQLLWQRTTWWRERKERAVNGRALAKEEMHRNSAAAIQGKNAMASKRVSPAHSFQPFSQKWWSKTNPMPLYMYQPISPLLPPQLTSLFLPSGYWLRRNGGALLEAGANFLFSWKKWRRAWKDKKHIRIMYWGSVYYRDRDRWNGFTQIFLYNH